MNLKFIQISVQYLENTIRCFIDNQQVSLSCFKENVSHGICKQNRRIKNKLVKSLGACSEEVSC